MNRMLGNVHFHHECLYYLLVSVVSQVNSIPFIAGYKGNLILYCYRKKWTKFSGSPATRTTESIAWHCKFLDFIIIIYVYT